MKNSILILMLFAGLTAFGQLSQINTSNHQTNVTTETIVFDIPGVATNLTGTITKTNVVIGDTLPTAFGKVNNGWNWLTTSVRTTNATANGQTVYKTNDATGYYWGAPTGGSGGTSNAVPIIDGGATNLTVTNSFTLLSLNGSISYSSITISNQGTFFPVGTTGYFTNTNGDVISILGSGTDPSIPGDPGGPGTGGGGISDGTNSSFSTNSIYPFNGFASQVNYIQVTNGVGSGFYYPFDPIHFLFINNSTTNSTDSRDVTIYGSSNSQLNQTYHASDTNFGTYYYGTLNTNFYIKQNYGGPSSLLCWGVFSNATSLYDLLNGGTWPAVGAWTNYGSTSWAGTAPFPSSYLTTNSLTVSLYWTYYSSNCWRFFTSTNPVAFTSPSQEISGSNILEGFYVTNITTAPVTNSSPTNSSTAYTANNSSTVIFYGFPQPTNGYYWSGYIPGTTNTMIITWDTNVDIGSLTNDPPPTVGTDPCQTYICATVSGVCKHLKNGWQMVQESVAFNTALGIQTSYLDIAADGTATWVLFNTVAKVIPWDDADWANDVPADSCVTCQQFSPQLPCTFSGFSSKGGGGSLGGGITVTLGGSN